MSVSSVLNKLNTFKGKPLEHASKALGFATLASVIYDSHINGRENAIIADSLDTADRFEQNYRQNMTMHRSSQTVADLKNAFFGIQRSLSIHHIISKAFGYISGALKTIVGDIPEIALSILALKTRNHKILGKTSGILLGFNTLKVLLLDVMGIEK